MSVSDLEILFNEHFNCAVYMAQTIVSSKEIAEDIVQNVFIKLLDVDTKEIKFPARFLYACVRNAALDYSRSHAHSMQAMNNFRIMTQSDRADAEQFDCFPAEEAENMTRVRQLFSAVEQLPPRTREVVKHVYFDNLTYQQTADLLGVSLATVKSHMYQSFRMLREKLTGLHKDRRQKKSSGL